MIPEYWMLQAKDDRVGRWVRSKTKKKKCGKIHIN